MSWGLRFYLAFISRAMPREIIQGVGPDCPDKQSAKHVTKDMRTAWRVPWRAMYEDIATCCSNVHLLQTVGLRSCSQRLAGRRYFRDKAISSSRENQTNVKLKREPIIMAVKRVQ